VQLYSYFRSSAAYRVRIALALKGLDYEYLPIHLQKGEQGAESYRMVNPLQLVPTFIDDDATLTQSMAIMEYIEEKYPQPPILPRSAEERARVRAIALTVACDIHPLNNLRVLRYLVHTLKVSEDAKNEWYRHWVQAGLAALESMLEDDPATGRCCHGDTPTIADACLIPQLANARRMNVPLDAYATLLRIDEYCGGLEAFSRAAPERQPDAQP
jgi:maleylpyruvate isomerase